MLPSALTAWLSGINCVFVLFSLVGGKDSAQMFRRALLSEHRPLHRPIRPLRSNWELPRAKSTKWRGQGDTMVTPLGDTKVTPKASLISAYLYGWWRRIGASDLDVRRCFPRLKSAKQTRSASNKRGPGMLLRSVEASCFVLRSSFCSLCLRLLCLTCSALRVHELPVGVKVAPRIQDGTHLSSRAGLLIINLNSSRSKVQTQTAWGGLAAQLSPETPNESAKPSLPMGLISFGIILARAGLKKGFAPSCSMLFFLLRLLEQTCIQAPSMFLFAFSLCSLLLLILDAGRVANELWAACQHCLQILLFPTPGFLGPLFYVQNASIPTGRGQGRCHGANPNTSNLSGVLGELMHNGL